MTGEPVGDRLLAIAAAAVRARLNPTSQRWHRRVAIALFGDRTGIAVFLGAVCLFWIYWRIGVFITDTYTVANAVHALAGGHLDLRTAQYGSSLRTPGTYRADGRVYARNYGVVVAALPFVALLRGVSYVADLRIFLVAAWSLLLLAFSLQVGTIVDRKDSFVIGGSALALLAFVGNVAVATPLGEQYISLIALQLLHVIVAGLVAVLLYRLLHRMHGRRVGIAAGATVALGTPLGLWASVPKRHVVIGAISVGIAYCLYRSRAPTDGSVIDRSVYFRALAYALVGLAAWIHAPEALLLLIVLVTVDVPTAPSNDARTLAIVGTAFALSLVPFLVTNTLISGSPIEPPRMLQKYGAASETSVPLEPAGDGSGGTVSDGSGKTGGRWSPLRPILSTLDPLLFPVVRLFEVLAEGARETISSPSTVALLYLQSSYTLDYTSFGIGWVQATNLAVLESAPVLAAVAATIPATAARVRTALLDRPLATLGAKLRSINPTASPERSVDIYAVLVTTAFTFLYIPWFPIHAQVTVRYLFPAYMLLTYAVFRSPPVRRVVESQWRLFVWSLAAAFLIGGQLIVVSLSIIDPGLGEAFQFHGLLALAVGLVVAIWGATGRADGWYGRLGAVALALATAAGGLFVTLVTLEYYPVGNEHALPLVRALAEALSLVG